MLFLRTAALVRRPPPAADTPQGVAAFRLRGGARRGHRQAGAPDRQVPGARPRGRLHHRQRGLGPRLPDAHPRSGRSARTSTAAARSDRRSSPPTSCPRAPRGLKIECRLNGKALQSSTTGAMIFDVASLIKEASAIFALEPGGHLRHRDAGRRRLRAQAADLHEARRHLRDRDRGDRGAVQPGQGRGLSRPGYSASVRFRAKPAGAVGVAVRPPRHLGGLRSAEQLRPRRLAGAGPGLAGMGEESPIAGRVGAAGQRRGEKRRGEERPPRCGKHGTAGRHRRISSACARLTNRRSKADR